MTSGANVVSGDSLDSTLDLDKSINALNLGEAANSILKQGSPVESLTSTQEMLIQSSRPPGGSQDLSYEIQPSAPPATPYVPDSPSDSESSPISTKDDSEGKSGEPTVASEESKAERRAERKRSKELRKANSTSNIFAESTISSPWSAETEYYSPYHIAHLEVFDEEIHPLQPNTLCAVPNVLFIERYIRLVTKVGQVPPESLIMSIAYLNRINETNPKLGYCLFPSTWRRLMLAALMLATKVWEDEPVWNSDFVDLFPTLTTKELLVLERNILALVNFNCTLTASQYATVYFDLRAASPSIEAHFKDIKLLDHDGQARLEQRSAAFTSKAAQQKQPQRLLSALKSQKASQSETSFKTLGKSPKVILN